MTAKNNKGFIQAHMKYDKLIDGGRITTVVGTVPAQFLDIHLSQALRTCSCNQQ